MLKARTLFDIIKDHIRDEIRIRKDLFSGKRSCKEHIYDRIDIHKKVYHDLKRAWENRYQIRDR